MSNNDNTAIIRVYVRLSNRVPTHCAKVSALMEEPYFRKLLLKTMSEMYSPAGKTNAMAKKALHPNIATNPGLMINVAALVMDAASDNPTTTGEKPLPMAKSFILAVCFAPLYARYSANKA